MTSHCEKPGAETPKLPEAAQKRRRERGLTLVELLVVLLILALIAAFAVPRLMRYVSSARSDAA